MGALATLLRSEVGQTSAGPHGGNLREVKGTASGFPATPPAGGLSILLQEKPPQIDSGDLHRCNRLRIAAHRAECTVLAHASSLVYQKQILAVHQM